ncbi:LytR/AlgR family response regulator transcription factor [Thermoflavifilum thermophilum]|uniref:Two component transcriptional regulator, LytTR family n=1 Tax=Thermoflavifilum thermophilum TaxID=1393122 RepID=A0A1I7NDT1_9BACT|nr:LytTR family DNA-binding domain-containing protein [Thermoflavifilum thermophilum]SFV32837.1 two component transcriptional regulator, LytTR family [Thermoflavifilum thermophilum]
MLLKCMIVDDEYPARVLLNDYANKLPLLQVVASCKTALEAMAVLREQSVDLIFLDIQMPELTGLEFLQSLAHPPLVILTTAYADYALKGYELNVVDYLLKPFSFERFVQAVNKAAERFQLSQGTTHVSSIASAPPEQKSFIVVKADHKLHRIYYDDILFIEGLREYVAFHTAFGKIITLESLKKLEDLLPADTFIRVHKSYIVNKKKVKSLYGNQLDIAGHWIPIGKLYRDEVVKHLFS